MTSSSHPAGRSGLRAVGLVVGLASLTILAWFAFSGQARPATLGYDRSGFLTAWNQTALA